MMSAWICSCTFGLLVWVQLYLLIWDAGIVLGGLYCLVCFCALDLLFSFDLRLSRFLFCLFICFGSFDLLRLAGLYSFDLYLHFSSFVLFV